MKKIRILIVDDAKFMRDLAQKTLKSEYPEVDTMEATDGRKAQAILQQHSFDLVLCDWEMPEMTGIELLEWTRAQDNLKVLPFIMVTSLDKKERVVEALQAGVNDYIAKPYNAEQLIGKVLKQLVKSGCISQADIANMGRKDRVRAAGGAELLAGAAAPAVTARKPPRQPPRCKGLLSWGERRSAVMVREINLQEAVLVCKCSQSLPTLAAEVTLALAAGSEENSIKVTVTGFISSLQLAERKPESENAIIKLLLLSQDQETMAQFRKFLSLIG
ncbi:MAG: response regulator, partial [Marinospirillum sp.]|uniref:response regulator n=1 Tax=Marinospirillum sp. TaxID=2183934 RepID=UPI001A06FBB3